MRHPGVEIEVTWCDHKLERTFSSDKAGRRAFGQERWAKLKLRIAVLENADTLADVRYTPGKWHALGADRAGDWAASLDGNWRLIIRPDNDTLPRLANGGLDVARVTKVKILEVVDYHGR